MTASTQKTSNDSEKKAHVWASRYKTSLCEKFEETGSCNFGNFCMFAHGEKDKRTVCSNFRDGLVNKDAIRAHQRSMDKRARKATSSKQPQAQTQPKPQSQFKQPPPPPALHSRHSSAPSYNDSSFCTGSPLAPCFLSHEDSFSSMGYSTSDISSACMPGSTLSLSGSGVESNGYTPPATSVLSFGNYHPPSFEMDETISIDSRDMETSTSSWSALPPAFYSPGYSAPTTPLVKLESSQRFEQDSDAAPSVVPRTTSVRVHHPYGW